MINKIGIFDSGVGGLGILHLVEVAKICKEIIYYADNKNIPYGIKSKDELIKLCQDAIIFFENNQVDLIIFACNTASSVIKYLKSSVKIITILDYALLNLQDLKNQEKVLVVATKAMLDSQIYQKTCENLNIQADFINPKEFVNIVENMEFQNSKKYFFQYFSKKDYKFVLLACTHYPFLKKQFQEYFVNAKLIDPAISLVNSLKKDYEQSKNSSILIFKASKDINILNTFYKRIINA